MTDNQRRGWAAGSAAVVLLLGGLAGWAMLPGEDPDLVAIRELRAGLSEPELPPEKRRETFEAIRTAVEALPEEKREIARDELREGFRARRTEMLNEWFAAPEEEKTAKIDELLDRIVARRNSGERGGPPRGGPGGRGDRPNDADSRNARRKERLNASTPEMRAKMGEFRDALRERADERGIELGGRFGR